MDFQICQNTQSPEKFLCLNQECSMAEKKHIQCYQCLTKYHLSKNKVVRHADDFIELEQFMNEIKKKYNKRHIFIQQILQQALDFQKSKIQEIQLTKNGDLIKSATEKIEGDTTKFSKSLSSLYLEQKFTFPYQNSFHVQYVKFYFEDENKYQDDCKQKLGILISQIEKYMQTLDLDILTTMKRSYKKVEMLEKQITYFSKQTMYNKLQFLILLLILPYLVYLQYNQFEIIQYQKQQEQRVQIQDYLIEEIQNQKDKFNIFENKQQRLQLDETNNIQTLNNTILEVMDALQKLKIRFETFKQSSTLNLEKSRIDISSIHEVLQKNISDLNNQEVILKNQIEQIKSRFDLVYVKEIEWRSNMEDYKRLQLAEKRKTKVQIEIMKEKNVMRKIVQLKNYIYALTNYRHMIQIHRNLKKTNLKDFELIYDELFDKPVLIYTMMSIQQKVFKNEGDNPLLCLGGLYIKNKEKIDLIACDFANDILSPTFETDKAIKSSHGNIYWYQVQESSFGFAPNENIKLIHCDDYDEKDEYRLSYWYNIGVLSGGRRLGSQLSLDNSTQHRLQIYLLKPIFE
ncbi:unnamed protein product [Paramecium sonneborni]|uniref:Uncharacterized protein n=1 Tax=Paramecium sonneborni TaxID=65129 RepID=A0A8S1KIJ9_9CILI|nr:unnamed protein product [Paramecium sonneborni]